MYDPTSKTLFSGDMGASLLPTENSYRSVVDFARHLTYMDEFHRRYMASSIACRMWAAMVRELDVERIVPQHGAMLEGQAMVAHFLDWVADLRCGVDLIDETMYRIPQGKGTRLKQKAAVVIIGGGIQGTSVACHLAQRSVRDVVLVEADLVGSGSSGRSAAMILLQMSREHTIRLSQQAFKEYLHFEQEFGADIGYKPIGYLNLATKEIADELRAQVALQHQFGVPTEILLPDDIKRRVPAVMVDDIEFGSVCWQDGVIDPHMVMQTYVQRARQLGAEINEQVEATGITVEKGRVVGVQTSAGLISTPLVVNAAGARAAQVGSWVGLKLPITNYKRTVFITDRFDEIADDAPFVNDMAVEWYFRKEGKGVLMGMGLEESTTFEPQLDWEFLDTMIQRALHRAPILANARVMRGWAGLRPLTPDDYPILGRALGVDGFINACGWGGHGVMHAPIGGKLIAELIAEGKTTTMDLAPFVLERFQ